MFMSNSSACMEDRPTFDHDVQVSLRKVMTAHLAFPFRAVQPSRANCTQASDEIISQLYDSNLFSLLAVICLSWDRSGCDTLDGSVVNLNACLLSKPLRFN